MRPGLVARPVRDGRIADSASSRARLRGEAPADLVEGLDEASTVVVRRDETAGGLEHLGEIRPAEIGHAQHAQTAFRVVADRVHRHDVGMLEPRKDLRLVSVGPRHLDGHRPAAQADLLGEVNPRECAAAQLEDDAKAREHVTWLRQATECACASRAWRSFAAARRPPPSHS